MIELIIGWILVAYVILLTIRVSYVNIYLNPKLFKLAWEETKYASNVNWYVSSNINKEIFAFWHYFKWSSEAWRQYYTKLYLHKKSKGKI